ncbi:MAG: hypothetical protein ACRDT0_10865 [Pseudonocardiaceae bacterium]
MFEGERLAAVVDDGVDRLADPSPTAPPVGVCDGQPPDEEPLPVQPAWSQYAPDGLLADMLANEPAAARGRG